MSENLQYLPPSKMFAKTKNNRKAKRRNLWQQVMLCGKDFCLETSIQGFNHIVAPGRHWTERFLWVGVLCVSVWCMAEISLGQLQRYQENPTVVTLEKDFRNWNFSLPAVTACNEDRVDPKKLEQAILSRWNVTPGHERYSFYQRFVSTVANADLFHLDGYQEYANTNDESLDVDLKELVVDVMVDQQVKTSISLNVIATWVPVMTEVGVCYVTNSLPIADVALVKPSSNYTEGLPHTCKYSSMSCYIMFEVFNNVDFYVHSPYDVMDATFPPSRTYVTLNRFTELMVSETRAGAGVRQLSSTRRRCLYTDEPVDRSRRVYSTNSCRLACRSSLAQQLCGCVPFYYFYAGPKCRVSGMRCLAAHGARLASARCVCGQPCVDAIFRELVTDNQVWGRGPLQNKGSVRFTVQAPRARYTREIVFHFQDLVVSFGGAAGLFLGASFISFVEILFFVLHRCLRIITVQEHTEQNEIKKSRTTFETTRIQDISSILEGRRVYNRRSVHFNNGLFFQ